MGFSGSSNGFLELLVSFLESVSRAPFFKAHGTCLVYPRHVQQGRISSANRGLPTVYLCNPLEQKSHSFDLIAACSHVLASGAW